MLYDGALIVLIVIVVICGLGTTMALRNGHQDTAIEEFTEALIERETGIDVDLSPDSPENN